MLLPQSAAIGQERLLRLATGELPPYATVNRPDQGIALHIVRRAFELMDYRVEYTFMPWSRSLAETRSGKWDGTAYWGRKPEHEGSFLLSENVLTEQWVFVHRKAVAFHWATMNDLLGYRLAIIQDYTYTPAFWALVNAGKLRVEKVSNDQAALKMLILGRIDAVPMEQNVACDLLRVNHTAAEADLLGTHPKLMTESFTTHLMLPKSRPESAGRLADFNAGLKKLRATGEYDKLLGKTPCPVSWTPSAKAK